MRRGIAFPICLQIGRGSLLDRLVKPIKARYSDSIPLRRLRGYISKWTLYACFEAVSMRKCREIVFSRGIVGINVYKKSGSLDI